MSLIRPFPLMKWIDEHRHLLRPPVNNQVIYPDKEFIIMVVGGPNARSDFHVNEGEEFYYQLEGDICLRVIEDGKFSDIPIRQGEIFLLPPKVPHSPQRPAGSVGLVVERRRRPEELDGFQWYCQGCQRLLYEEFLPVTNIVTQLPPVFKRFYENEKHTTCHHCGRKHAQD